MHGTDFVGNLCHNRPIGKVINMEDFCYNAECQWRFETVDGEMACALTIDDEGFTLCANTTRCREKGRNVYDFIEEHMNEFLVDGVFDYDVFAGITMMNGFVPLRLKGVSTKSDRMVYNAAVNGYPVTIVSANDGLNYVIR